jgi:hypothetical protein
MTNWMRTVVIGFAAGALGVLIFHQFGFWLTNEMGRPSCRRPSGAACGA